MREVTWFLCGFISAFLFIAIAALRIFGGDK